MNTIKDKLGAPDSDGYNTVARLGLKDKIKPFFQAKEKLLKEVLEASTLDQLQKMQEELVREIRRGLQTPELEAKREELAQVEDHIRMRAEKKYTRVEMTPEEYDEKCEQLQTVRATLTGLLMQLDKKRLKHQKEKLQGAGGLPGADFSGVEKALSGEGPSIVDEDPEK